MYINSGGGTATNLSEFDVYRFPLEGYSSTNPPNTPAPKLLFTDDERNRDSHGSFTTKFGRYLWVMDRRPEVKDSRFRIESGRVVPGSWILKFGSNQLDRLQVFGDVAGPSKSAADSLRQGGAGLRLSMHDERASGRRLEGFQPEEDFVGVRVG
jgi:hypothetical protein